MNSPSLASLILRVSTSIFMMTHGWLKFMQILNGNFKFADPIGLGSEISLILAAFAEFICSILLLVGFKSKLAAIPPAITMLVAAFVVHAGDPWGKKEFPLLYFLCYVTIFFLGSGKYSLDARLNNR